MKALYAVAALCVLALAACGSGPKVTETRPVAAFDRIEVDGVTDVDVQTGPRSALQVTAGRKVIDSIDTKVQDGTLKVTGPHRGFDFITGDHGARVRVTVPSLRAVTIQGAGDVNLRGLA